MHRYKHYIWLLFSLLLLPPIPTEGQSLILTGNEILMQDELSFPQDSTRVQIPSKTGFNRKQKSAGQQLSSPTPVPSTDTGKSSPSQQTKPEKPAPVYPPTISSRAFSLLSYALWWFIITLWKFFV